MKSKKGLDTRIRAYIDDLFSNVGETQQLLDLKEELAINIRERTEDYILRGLDEDRALREAIISMGDLGELVDDMRKLAQDTAEPSVHSTKTYISAAGIVIGPYLSCSVYSYLQCSI